MLAPEEEYDAEAHASVSEQMVKVVHSDYPTGIGQVDYLYREHAMRVRDYFTPPYNLLPNDEQIMEVLGLSFVNKEQLCIRLRELFADTYRIPRPAPQV